MRAAEWLAGLRVGDVHDFPPVSVTAEAIPRFAAEYDPQPFHLSEEGAHGTIFEHLAASGWHTAALTLQALAADAAWPVAQVHWLGFDALRWKLPVRPGDRLQVRAICEAAGVVEPAEESAATRLRIETFNQAGDLVMSYVALLRTD
ncbi:MAG TPA: MaoC/PaaZ C-terminal domain-containing protein [Nevskiaceae bacterium]|nr:MaoC/PaaZ C-terminal domain-containing protein [Nevskiaceae bacterium]